MPPRRDSFRRNRVAPYVYPIILAPLASGYDSACAPGPMDRCLAAGMDGYLSKPIRPKELDELLAAAAAARKNSSNSPDSLDLHPTEV